MVDSVKSLPTFTEVNFVTKNGEHITARKKDGIVTLVGDKNGTRQLPLSDFMKYLVENAQNIDLERQPQNDELSFKSRDVSASEKRKAYEAYRNAKPKKGTTVLGLASLAAMLPASLAFLLPEAGITKKLFDVLEKNKTGRIIFTILTAAGFLGTGISVIKTNREKIAVLKEMQNS